MGPPAWDPALAEEEEEILESDPDVDPYVRASADAHKLATMSLKVVRPPPVGTPPHLSPR